jgi:hypothetical protein
MKTYLKLAAAAALATATLAISASSASAWVVCNREGECWHTQARYVYAPEVGIVVHPDSWHWGYGERHVWREHAGHGYWHNGIWIRL